MLFKITVLSKIFKIRVVGFLETLFLMLRRIFRFPLPLTEKEKLQNFNVRLSTLTKLCRIRKEKKIDSIVRSWVESVRSKVSRRRKAELIVRRSITRWLVTRKRRHDHQTALDEFNRKKLALKKVCQTLATLKNTNKWHNLVLLVQQRLERKKRVIAILIQAACRGFLFRRQIKLRFEQMKQKESARLLGPITCSPNLSWFRNPNWADVSNWQSVFSDLTLVSTKEYKNSKRMFFTRGAWWATNGLVENSLQELLRSSAGAKLLPPVLHTCSFMVDGDVIVNGQVCSFVSPKKIENDIYQVAFDISNNYYTLIPLGEKWLGGLIISLKKLHPPQRPSHPSIERVHNWGGSTSKEVIPFDVNPPIYNCRCGNMICFCDILDRSLTEPSPSYDKVSHPSTTNAKQEEFIQYTRYAAETSRPANPRSWFPRPPTPQTEEELGPCRTFCSRCGDIVKKINRNLYKGEYLCSYHKDMVKQGKSEIVDTVKIRPGM